jgi:hypothetical protein
MAAVSAHNSADVRIWRSLPRCALAVRMLLALLPVITAFLVTWFTAPVLPRPAGPFGIFVYVAETAAIGVTAALLARRAADRFLPLTALLKMTLIFPDHAPSRFRLALRTGTIRQLRKALANGDPALPSDHQAAAERLITLAGELGRHERLTRGHSDRVRAYADMIGVELGLPPAQRQKLTWAAIVHDIGKLAVPADILNRAGRPSEVEWAILAQHPEAGSQLVEPLAGWLDDWRLSTRDHHERWDGTGYPNGLAGKDISLAGRIVAVADAFDTMTSHRSYHRAGSIEAAREELVRCSGSQFDPRVVRAMLDASLPARLPTAGLIGWFAALVARANLASIGRAVATASTAAAITTGAGLAPLGLAPFDLGPDGVLDLIRQSANVPAPPMLPFAAGPAVPSGPSTVRLQLTTRPVPDKSSVETQQGRVEPVAPTGPTSLWSAQAETTSTTAPPTTASTTTTASTGRTSTTVAPTTAATSTTTGSTTTTTTQPQPTGPTANDDHVSITSNGAKVIDVLANDVAGSAQLDPPSLAIVEMPSHAALVKINGSNRILYRSVATGVTDQLRYKICDVSSICATATLTITLGTG